MKFRCESAPDETKNHLVQAANLGNVGWARLIDRRVEPARTQLRKEFQTWLTTSIQ
jgi:hypothetical protein